MLWTLVVLGSLGATVVFGSAGLVGAAVVGVSVGFVVLGTFVVDGSVVFVVFGAEVVVSFGLRVVVSSGSFVVDGSVVAGALPVLT